MGIAENGPAYVKFFKIKREVEIQYFVEGEFQSSNFVKNYK